MNEYKGHQWVLIRYNTDHGVVIPWEHDGALVRTQDGDALDLFMEQIFTGIRDDCLEVVMSEDD